MLSPNVILQIYVYYLAEYKLCGAGFMKVNDKMHLKKKTDGKNFSLPSCYLDQLKEIVANNEKDFHFRFIFVGKERQKKPTGY